MAEAIAHELAKKQKEISVAEFFERNKHILGFGNPTRALVTSVKEGVDNILDACEESGILPDIHVEIKKMANVNLLLKTMDRVLLKNRFPISLEDYSMVLDSMLLGKAEDSKE